MRRIDIILMGEIEGGLAPFLHGDVDIRFHKPIADGDFPILEGAIWAFVPVPGAGTPDSRFDGIEICRRLRCHPRTARAHITAVLDRDDQDLRIMARNAGVDECMAGPLTRAAILDRALEADPRNFEAPTRSVFHHGELTVDVAAYQARWAGKPIPLSPNEFRLLRFLVENSGRVFTRSQLIAALGKQEPAVDERTVDVWVGRLRRALRAAGAPRILRTVRSLGYILDSP